MAHYPTQGTSIWHSIKYADVLPYEAKNSGKIKLLSLKKRCSPRTVLNYRKKKGVRFYGFKGNIKKHFV